MRFPLSASICENDSLAVESKSCPVAIKSRDCWDREAKVWDSKLIKSPLNFDRAKPVVFRSPLRESI